MGSGGMAWLLLGLVLVVLGQGVEFLTKDYIFNNFKTQIRFNGDYTEIANILYVYRFIFRGK